MEVLIISISDELNGASKALLRINNSLNTLKNLNSRMLVYKKISEMENINELSLSGLKRLKFNLKKKINNYLISFLYPNKGSYTLFSHNFFSSNEIYNQIKKEKFDILVLGWVNSGIFNFEKINDINKPILIVMQDMWYFTGGCHYSNKCSKYKDKCYNCQELSPKYRKDLSSYGFDFKNQLFQGNNNLFFIAVSNWIYNRAKESSILRNKNIYQIPNSIDPNVFKKVNVKNKIVEIPDNKKILLFGATRAINDKRKGIEYLLRAFEKLDDSFYLIIFGSNETILKKNIKNYGYVNSTKELIKLLSLADVFIAPSEEEACSLAVLEAMSCSLPVISFKNTGMETQIEHKKTGYLAEHLNSDDLAIGIKWVFENNDDNILGKEARNKVLNEFSYNSVSINYKNLINKITNNDI
jgi:glycosyltransferase involved in cell wall biosynthesis